MSSGITCSELSNTLGGDIEAIRYIILDVLHLEFGETSIAEHLAGDLLTPHRSKPGPVSRQRDGHAMVARDGVEERCQRMLHILFERA